MSVVGLVVVIAVIVVCVVLLIYAIRITTFDATIKNLLIILTVLIAVLLILTQTGVFGPTLYIK